MILRHPISTRIPLAPDLQEKMRGIQPASLGHYLTNGIVSPEIRPMTSGKLLGRALTVRLPLPDGVPVHLVLDDLQPGDVLVIDRAGDHHIACVGEMVARAALAAGAAGIVVDGVVTDIEELRELGLPVYARGTNVVTLRALHAPGAELFGSVLIGGVIVRNGDLLFGDVNGLMCLDPNNQELPALVGKAIADEEREVEWRKRLANGETLSILNGYGNQAASTE